MGTQTRHVRGASRAKRNLRDIAQGLATRSGAARKSLTERPIPPGYIRVCVIPLLSVPLLAYAPAAFAKPDACNIVGGVATCTGNQSNGVKGGVDFPLATTYSLTVKDLTSSIFPGSGTAIQWRLTNPNFSVNELFSSPDYSLFGFAPTGGFAAGIDLESQGGPSGSGAFLGLTVNGSATASGAGGAAVYVSDKGNNGSGGGGDGDGGDPGRNGGFLNTVLGSTPADPIAHNGVLTGLGPGTSGIAEFGKAGAGGNGHGGTLYSGGNGGQGGAGGSVYLTATGGDWAITSSGQNAPGVLLQSNGGNGGNGGNSSFTTGGTGGKGGQGGTVRFEITSGQDTIGTAAGDPGSPGLLLISQAGSGGTGGSGKFSGDGGTGGAGGGGGPIDMFAPSLTITTLANSAGSPGVAAYSLGGTGGRGGDGGYFSGGGGSGGDTGPSGTIDVNLQGGMIQTQAANSAGIIAQSIAGHAGAGGGQIPASLAAFGANGGSAGAAGTVKATNGAAIRTNSDESAAIFAESAGGGGGNGGASFGVFYSSGGNGGVGGAGGQVTVNNTGSLTTSGADSEGILAQSVGGAGGDGGIPGGVASALGGHAAQGSNGQTVTVVNSGFISTGAQPIKDVKIEQATVDPACSFACSDGILAQSVGGGGGVGGAAVGGWFSLGGTGGGGGNGGTVDLTNTGSIVTRLNDSVGLAAQSIGGGGGDGGGSVSVQALGAVAIGAKGGAGGNGGLVQVLPTSGMQMQTLGANSTGILAQSIGGGGGNGGYAAAISGGTNFAVSVAIGGSGAAGGNGREVIVNTMDSDYKGPPDIIKTAGDDSDGILAQSIGQGGGNGGFTVSAAGAAKGASIALAMGGGGGAGGNGGVATITSDATIKTEGYNSSGLVAQSIGKGGGDAGLTVAGAVDLTGVGIGVALGGSGGDSGSASLASIYNYGSIETQGASSDGILAQSVGKGGGNAGVTVTAAASVGGNQSGNISVAVGGKGGRGGDAGPVILKNYAPVTVTGPQSMGLVAESTGGGGGNANFTISATLQGKNAKELGLAIGGNGEVAGNGGDVDLVNTAAVQTGSPDVDPAMAQGSPGIVASSSGGSGGSGSYTAAVTLGSGGSSTPVEAAVAVGGAGLGGGDAGTVTLDNSGSVKTYADKSAALEASSIGGGGGDAGYALAATGTLGGQTGNALGASVVVGQGGGAGGVGGIVTVTNTNAELQTFGMNSDAIQAHSEGGGGGNAAAVLAFTATTVKNEVAANIAVGGKGGKGDTGGAVTVDNSGTLITNGQNSDGVRADSVGGTGGNGAITLSGLALNDGYAVDVSVGGNGGEGNTGGDVTVISHGAILTTGVKADGISAMSTGGGGGSALQTTAAGLSGINVDVGVGGVGGDGDNGGIVDVENYNSITTSGAWSRGIFAQSIGGGGGDSQAISVGLSGSDAKKSIKMKLAVQVGRPGASGGNGGDVTVTNNGNVTTGAVPAALSAAALPPAAAIPTNESGIVAQSIGGGGGNGGSALVLPGLSGGDSTYTFSVAVGGGGGEGGVGGTTIVNNRGTITTSDTESYGIFAQSVGGGGGKGGIVTAIPGVLSNKTDTLNISASIGGEGGEGNVAGPVTVNNGGTVITNGDGSHGIFAQSVGGGGGDGGSAFNYFIGVPKGKAEPAINFSLSLGGKGGSGGDGKTVTVTNGLVIKTTGEGANGIEAQSIGGGGGEAGNGSSLTTLFKTASLNVGGNGGEGENGGTVTINQTRNGSPASEATITTTGSNSSGIYAQSIGGGGGRGGVGADSQLFSVGLGGSGGVNGNGGAVNVNINGGSITTGTNTTDGSNSSYGIFAQSVGGGGGQAGGAGFGIIDSPTNRVTPPSYIGKSIPMGSGDSSGNGGAVTVTMDGSITTKSNNGVGIFAQSIGGGGGIAGQSGNPATCPAPCSDQVGSVGEHGSAGPVTVKLTGAITTNGQYSHGVFAQSAAGSASAAGNVSVSLAAGSSIRVNGPDADAIFVQSVGGTNGTITVNNAGFVQGGSGDSYGVHYLDGGANTLVNAGTITTLNGVNGVVLRTDGGQLKVSNSGSIIGDWEENDAPPEAADVSFAPESITNTGRIIGNLQIHNQASVVINGGSGGTFGRFSGGAITISNGDLTFAGGNTALSDNIVVKGGARTVTNDGRLLVTAPVAVTGDFDQSTTGELDFLLSGSGDPPDQLDVTGAVSLAGGLGIDLAKGFNLAAGDSFDLIGSDDALSGGFGAFSLDGAACAAHGADDWRCGGFLFDLSMVTGALDSVDLSVASTGIGGGAVPEPSTWAMLIVGFLGLGGLALRRRQRALAA